MDSLRRKKINKPLYSARPTQSPIRDFALSSAPSDISADKKPLYAKNVSTNLFIKKKSKENIPKKNFKLIKKIAFSLFFILLVGALTTGIFFTYKVNTLSTKINATDASRSKTPILETLSDISKITSDERIVLKGEDVGQINILLLGMAGKGKPGGELTDTLMIASIDTKNNKIALLSLPRDLYATVPEKNYSAKINSLYKYGLANNEGVEPLKKTIENITSLSINYYSVVNFSGFEKFIDDIGGVNVQVERDIYDASYPGPNYSYETFEIKKGLHKLDGSTALKYARERHDDPEGDFGRAKRQQQVIQAAKNKVFSNKTLFNPFAINNLLNTLGDNIQTDMSLEEMDSFLKLAKNLDTQNINNSVVDAWKEDSLLKVSHIFYENSRAFILIPRIGNYTEIQDLAKNIFDLKILEERKIAVKKENPAIAIIDNTGNYGTYSQIEKILKKKLGFENIQKINYNKNISSDKTMAFDLSSNKNPFSLDELIKKIPATFDKDNSSLSIEIKEDIIKYDLLLILGKDLNDIYAYEEDSLEDLQKAEANQELLMMQE